MVSWLDNRVSTAASVIPGGHPSAAATAATVALDVRTAVLSVISERTGYPVELIEMNLDLEADLSVDSIKRAEVAGEVVNRLGLSTDRQESALEELVKARTVAAMVSWLETRISGALEESTNSDIDARPQITVATSTSPGIAPQRLITRLERIAGGTGTAVTGEQDLNGAAGQNIAGATFLITGETEVGGALTQLLSDSGATGR